MVTTEQITIWMAGDIAAACSCVRAYCYRKGACFTVTPTRFIYTGGEEDGFAIGLVNYPRFPCTPAELTARAKELALELLVQCNQRSCLLVNHDTTEWLTVTPPGATETT